jgi:hypothetical protein
MKRPSRWHPPPFQCRHCPGSSPTRHGAKSSRWFSGTPPQSRCHCSVENFGRPSGGWACVALLSLASACHRSRPPLAPPRPPAAPAQPPGPVVPLGVAQRIPGQHLRPPVPVPSDIIVDEPPAEIAEIAVIRPSPSHAARSYGESCLVRRGCPVAAPTLPTCEPGPTPPRWSELLPSAASLAGRIIRVRGPLGIGWFTGTRHDCARGSGRSGCCNSAGAAVLLGGAPETLGLQGLFCMGDESQTCCNAPAYGQEVVVTGFLTTARTDGRGNWQGGLPTTPRWSMKQVKLCTETR